MFSFFNKVVSITITTKLLLTKPLLQKELEGRPIFVNCRNTTLKETILDDVP